MCHLDRETLCYVCDDTIQPEDIKPGCQINNHPAHADCFTRWRAGQKEKTDEKQAKHLLTSPA